jgi:hypothetical protein
MQLLGDRMHTGSYSATYSSFSLLNRPSHGSGYWQKADRIRIPLFSQMNSKDDSVVTLNLGSLWRILPRVRTRTLPLNCMKGSPTGQRYELPYQVSCKRVTHVVWGSENTEGCSRDHRLPCACSCYCSAMEDFFRNSRYERTSYRTRGSAFAFADGIILVP